MVALSGRWEGINISNLPLRVVALSGRGGGDQYRKPSPAIGGAIGEGGDQYRQPSPTSDGAIREGEGINIGNLPLRVVALSGRGEGINIGNLPLRVVALSGRGEGINIGNLPLRVVALSWRGRGSI